MTDPRIGKHGEAEPRVCAVTGEPLHEKPHTTHSLGGGYYYRTLAKVSNFDREALHRELHTIINPPRRKQTQETEE